MRKFYVAGIGPGNPDYLIPFTKKIIEEADILIGGVRQLKIFESLKKREYSLEGKYNEVIDYIRINKKSSKIVVLVSGDPGFHSFLKMIISKFSNNDFDICPGISCFQYAMSKIGKVWNNFSLISFHGSNQSIKNLSKSSGIIFLTDSNNTPYTISKLLISEGHSNRTAYIAENLSYKNERISKYKLYQIKEEEYKLCIMIVE